MSWPTFALASLAVIGWTGLLATIVFPPPPHRQQIAVALAFPTTPTPTAEQPVLLRPTPTPALEVTDVPVPTATALPALGGVVAAGVARTSREDAIRAVLAGMPLSYAAGDLVAAADRHGLDWRLLPAIGFWESSGGKAMCAPYNAFGWGCPVGFSSWETAIEVVANGLTQPPYWNRTISGILAVYNPSGGEEYREKVMSTMSRLEAAR